MPRQAAQPGKKLLTSEEVKRALFIDYEGSKSRKFQATLLGIMADREIGRASCRERVSVLV